MRTSTLVPVVVALLPSILALPQATNGGGHDSSPDTVAADGSYIQTVLDHHNVHRANHSAPALTWSTTMATAAQELAEQCIFQHNNSIGGHGYGQNIGAGVPPSNISNMITSGFYNNEEPLFQWYGAANPDYANFDAWGHFTQVVWKGSKTVGCFTKYCGPGGLQGVTANVLPFFTVCNYLPVGNVRTEFGKNVGVPLNSPTVNGGYVPPGQSTSSASTATTAPSSTTTALSSTKKTKTSQPTSTKKIARSKLTATKKSRSHRTKTL